MTEPLAGQVALVTGAGRGIGRAIALALARSGARLGLMARTEPELQATASAVTRLGRQALVLTADVSDPEAVDVTTEKMLAAFGRIDVLVNNAGIQGPIGPLAETPVEGWMRTIQVNLVGTFLMTRAVLPQMMARRRGKVINLSGGGATGPRPFFSAYAASKTAVVRLTETLAEELKPYNIQVNAVAPGSANTRMTEEILAAGERAGAQAFADAQRQRRSEGASPERAAALVVFLASPISDGVTGRLVSAVYDDWENLPMRIDEVMTSDLFTLRRVAPVSKLR